MIKAIEEIMRIKPISWMKAGAYALGMILLYYSALVQMIFHDWVREDYSHCYIIPFLVLYLLWEKRSALSSSPSVPSWKGAVPLLFGLGLFWLGELGGEFFTLCISLWLVVVGLIWLHIGWRKLREMGYVLFMMLTMEGDAGSGLAMQQIGKDQGTCICFLIKSHRLSLISSCL